MVFKMFIGGRFEHTHEREQMEQIRKNIQRVYERIGSEWCGLYTDITINEWNQIDGSILDLQKEDI